MKFLANKQPGADLKEYLNKRDRKPVACAISYIGMNAHLYLPLRKGDILVCDAEEVTIKGGSTDAESLDYFYRRGVKIYSRMGLHAKVVAGNRTAWVGSANASATSSKRKIEASLRVSDKEIVGQVRSFIEELTLAPGTSLKRKDIDSLLAMPRVRGFERGSLREPEELPEALKTMRVVRFHDYEPTPKDLELVASTRKEARKERSTLGTNTKLEEFYIDTTTFLRKNDWYVLTDGKKVMSPMMVLTLHRRKKGLLIWSAQPRVARSKVSIEELEKLLKIKFSVKADEIELTAHQANKVLEFFRN